MYRPNDLTIIVPTLGRNPALLNEVLGCFARSVHIIVVWDGHTPPPVDLLSISEKRFASVRIVAHDRNRGLSAARNTGVSHTKTPLCMFVDDDIIPETGFENKVVEFHNRHPNDNQMMVGCVTWRNGPHASPLTEWMETRTTWNLFHTIQENQPFPFFAGGFTSFKKCAMNDIQFDESFTKYGSEDTEFGYRFFRRGGELNYQPSVVGIHMKPMSLLDFRRDFTASGYSHGNMLDLHPDVGMDIGFIYRTITATLLPETLDSLCLVCEEMLKAIPNPGEDEQCDSLIRLVTNQCIQQGFLNYLIDKHEDFSEIRKQALLGKEISGDSLIAKIPNYAPFLYATAEQLTDQAACLQTLEKAISLCPHYAAPYILAFDRALPDSGAAHARLAHYLDRFGEQLDKQTENRILQRLNNGVSYPVDSMSARDLHFKLAEVVDSAQNDTIVALAQTILTKDISHVFARIAWARAIASQDTGLMRLLLLEAKYFLRNRPIHEQKTRHAEIAKLFEEHVKREKAPFMEPS